MYYGGESNVPGAPGNVAAVNPGGIPNRPVDPALLKRLQQQGTPPPPGFREQFGLPPAPESAPGSVPQASFSLPPMLAGGPSFDINRTPGTLGGRFGEQLKRLYEGGTQQNQQLNDELRRRGIMPGAGPQLPLAMGINQGMPPMGNAGLFPSAQQVAYSPASSPMSWQSAGFQNKSVS